jgi:hypothetical protein
MGDGEDASDERHLFGERRQTTTGFLASDMGVLRVELAPDRLGEFGIVERRRATDIAAGKQLAVATEDDVMTAGDDRTEFTPLGFGPAAAVGIDETTLYAASPDGTVARASIAAADGDTTEWETLGDVSGPRAFEGPVLATASGVVRVAPTFETLGLDDVADVASGDHLLAGGENGLFEYADGDWVGLFDRPITRVTAGDDAVCAVTADGAVLRRTDAAWDVISVPEGTTATAVAATQSLYVVTEAGDVLISADPTAATDGVGGWQSEPLGVRTVHGFVLDDA